jgi:hypothetical protein
MEVEGALPCIRGRHVGCIHVRSWTGRVLESFWESCRRRAARLSSSLPGHLSTSQEDARGPPLLGKKDELNLLDLFLLISKISDAYCTLDHFPCSTPTKFIRMDIVQPHKYPFTSVPTMPSDKYLSRCVVFVVDGWFGTVPNPS